MKSIRYGTSILLLALLTLFGCKKHDGSSGSESGTSGGAGTSGGSSKSSNDVAELAKLQGTWSVVSMEENGKQIKQESVERNGIKYVIEGDKVTTYFRGSGPKGNVQLDTGHSPKRFLFMSEDGKLPLLGGIYEVEADTLKLCIGVTPRGDSFWYPTDFVSTKEPSSHLYIAKKK
jgi:uncharacterized protein (TIGR03067 family)